MLQCVAVCWQCVAACCREEDLLRDLRHLQRLAVVLLLQCVAVCCSVLQRVAEKRTCYEISHTCSASELCRSRQFSKDSLMAISYSTFGSELTIEKSAPITESQFHASKLFCR